MLVEVFGRYQVESPQLVVKVAQARAATGATEEIWDANGIGMVAMQQRAPDPNSRRAIGVVPQKKTTKYLMLEQRHIASGNSSSMGISVGM